MSFSKTYAHTVLIAVDTLGAAIFWNRNGITISTLCCNAIDSGNPTWGWKALGKFLETINPGHLKASKAGDIARAKATVAFLEPQV